MRSFITHTAVAAVAGTGAAVAALLLAGGPLSAQAAQTTTCQTSGATVTSGTSATSGATSGSAAPGSTSATTSTVGRDGESQDGHGRAGAVELEAKVATIAERDPEILDRYVRMIRSRRNRPEGASIAIREEDVRAMELLLPTAPPAPGGG